MDARRSRIAELSGRILEASGPLNVLGSLEWPPHLEGEFLEAYRRGQPCLPRVEYDPVALEEPRRMLEAVLAELDEGDPVEGLLARTARSDLLSCDLLDARGRPEFGDRSVALYGEPSRVIPGTRTDSATAARHFLSLADRFPGVTGLAPDGFCVTAAAVRAHLDERKGDVLTEDDVRIELDPRLGAKAAAGPRRVRIRDRTCFSRYDPEQLLQHELFVHTLTALNGRRQPHLRVLADGSPRTTATQEGLASFAELVTGAMDMGRLRRLALRVVAIEAARGGADFVEVFRLFLEGGQSEAESYHSTRRVFRGGVSSGGAPFTKDGVYLEGILRVTAFLHWAFRSRRMDLAGRLFCGRLDIDDLFVLDALDDPDLVAPPRYLPPWMERVEALASFLAFSDFAARMGVDELGCPAAPGP